MGTLWGEIKQESRRRVKVVDLWSKEEKKMVPLIRKDKQMGCMKIKEKRRGGFRRGRKKEGGQNSSCKTFIKGTAQRSLLNCLGGNLPIKRSKERKKKKGNSLFSHGDRVKILSERIDECEKQENARDIFYKTMNSKGKNLCFLHT